MSYFDLLKSAATEAQSLLAQMQGMEPASAGNVLKDGAYYTCTPRAANAFELAAAGQEMGSHGFNDKSMLILSFTRDQFTGAPLNWRRGKLTLLQPAAQECTVVSVNTDDPLFYVLPVIVRGPL
jgi:hypothetical protein